MMFYRFSDGTFVEAETFAEAKVKKLKEIQVEQENKESWYKCTCLGFDHRHSCPENPWNSKNPDDIPY